MIVDSLYLSRIRILGLSKRNPNAKGKLIDTLQSVNPQRPSQQNGMAAPNGRQPSTPTLTSLRNGSSNGHSAEYNVQQSPMTTPTAAPPHPLGTLYNEVVSWSHDLWTWSATTLTRFNTERLQPLFTDQVREAQLRKMGEATSLQSKQDANQQSDRDLAVAALAVTLAAVGSLSFPLLQLLSVPGAIYSVRHMFQNSYRAFKQPVLYNKVHVHTLSSISLVTCLLGGYFVAAALIGLAYTFGMKLIAQVKRDSKQSLVNIFRQSAHMAWVLVDGVEVQMPLEQIGTGDQILLNAGETIPVDGIIVQGMASIDQHVLTGEAQPVEKGVGESVFALTLLLSGRILIEVQQAGTETTAAKIADLLNRTTDFKTTMQLRSEKLTQKTVWPTLGLSLLSLPVVGPIGAVAVLAAHFGMRVSAIGSIAILNYFRIFSRYGMLVKDGRTLELLPQVDTVVFDKTGTLTQEQPTIGQVYTSAGYDADTVLTLAAAAEHKQTHPIARAILHAAQERALALPPIDDATYKVGYGLSVHVNGLRVRVGSSRFMESEGLTLPPEIRQAQLACDDQGHSLVLVASDEAVIGAVELTPTLRPEAKTIIQGLRQRGIRSIIVISGDQEGPTRKLAQELAIDRYFAQTLPQNKAAIIEQLQAEGHTICYVGDGINDTIALKKAHVSVSLRGASTAATDTAQIILMSQNLQQLCRLFDLSQEFNATLERSFGLSLIGAGVGIGGIYLIGWQVVQVLLVRELVTLLSVGNVMWPLQRYRHLLLAQHDEEQEEMTR